MVGSGAKQLLPLQIDAQKFSGHVGTQLIRAALQLLELRGAFPHFVQPRIQFAVPEFSLHPLHVGQQQVFLQLCVQHRCQDAGGIRPAPA